MAPLPGTRREAHRLANVLQLPPERIGLELGASEARLRAVRGPKLLHIATHGFFLPDAEDAAGRLTPMLRSGLALSGFNHRAKAVHTDDGVLTALDVSGLDLYGTELVVLSACETGLGTVAQGDGIFGLKRALLLAGSRTQVLSLWKVDDHATEALMSAYYTRLLAGKDRVAAMRQVQLDLASGTLNPTTAGDAQRGQVVYRPKAKAAPNPKLKGWRHPYYWAAFTVNGASGPLPEE
jgi:CHAT domain-containing protein